jgi:3D (Asp-Asp-Asp) domain-containing protein
MTIETFQNKVLKKNGLMAGEKLHPGDQVVLPVQTTVPRETREASRGEEHCLVMEATAYCMGMTTKSGEAVAPGLAAVDPSVIPMGSNLYVEGYGFVKAADSGGAIKGNKIDLFMESESDCLAFGRREVKVWIER